MEHSAEKDAPPFRCEARRFEGADPCPSCASVGYCQAAHHTDTPLQWTKRTQAIVASWQRLHVRPDQETPVSDRETAEKDTPLVDAIRDRGGPMTAREHDAALVEKAAAALHVHVCGDDLDEFKNPCNWTEESETCYDVDLSGVARAVLDAVADDLRAEAWDEGHEVCEWPGCMRHHRNPYARATETARTRDNRHGVGPGSTGDLGGRERGGNE